MDQLCKNCFTPGDNVSNSEAYLRPEAFSQYIKLQQQGFRPVMCEDKVGKYRVCHATQRKAA